jgi:hypothetical protein
MYKSATQRTMIVVLLLVTKTKSSIIKNPCCKQQGNN